MRGDHCAAALQRDQDARFKAIHVLRRHRCNNAVVPAVEQTELACFRAHALNQGPPTFPVRNR